MPQQRGPAEGRRPAARRRAPARRPAGRARRNIRNVRSVRAFLLTTVVAAAVIAAAVEVIVGHFATSGYGLAEGISKIQTTESSAQLEHALKQRVLMIEASGKMKVIGSATLAKVPPPPGGAPMVPDPAPQPGTVQAIAYDMLPSYGFSPTGEYGCLDAMWTRESNWDYTATNPSSGAYGIPQSLPASKMAQMGSDWATNPRTQIEWGLWYIQTRYGSPCNAWAYWQVHNSY